MNVVGLAQPDVTLSLDQAGVIQGATLSNTLSMQDVSGWIGRPWVDTVTEQGDKKVRRMVEDAVRRQVSAFRQVTQRFPSGLELLIEYTTVSLGDNAGLIAVGKSLQAVTDLQTQLLSAQQEMEREYWKLRELETRYRLLFDSSSEAVLLVRAAGLRILEANPAAMRALGLGAERLTDIVGRDFLAAVLPTEREVVETMLQDVRHHGNAPAILVHLGRDRDAWLIRSSLVNDDTGLLFLVQLAPLVAVQPRPLGVLAPSPDTLLDGAPDAFLVLDRDARILKANAAFFERAGIAEEPFVAGEHLERWLVRRDGQPFTPAELASAALGPGAFLPAQFRAAGGSVPARLLAIRGGASAAGRLGLLVRTDAEGQDDATAAEHLAESLRSLTARLGETSLAGLLQEGARLFERHCLESAIRVARGDREQLAALLGLEPGDLRTRLDAHGIADPGSAPPAS